VPSGIWAAEEYDKLPLYDGETFEQAPHLFMCHQRDGSLCGGWLACHDPHELLALRLHWREAQKLARTDAGISPSQMSGRKRWWLGL
jgi:hypothetical protein